MNIFVFGSNKAGIHGAGAALFAFEQKGAVWGQGEGLQGQSYGIPTKSRRIKTLKLEAIGKYVQNFLHFARRNPRLEFQVTPIGCGLAGWTPKEIAPLFRGAPKNCILPPEFLAILNS